jgi:hypothetical protein
MGFTAGLNAVAWGKIPEDNSAVCAVSQKAVMLAAVRT